MRATVLRMSDKTVTAPYFSERLTIHRLRPFVVHDFVDVLAVESGSGSETRYRDGEARVRRLGPGHMVMYRPGDEILIRGADPDGLTVSYVSSPGPEWRIFSAMVGVDPSWTTKPEPPLVEFDAGSAEVLRPFELALERFRSGATSLDLVQFWIAIIPTMFPDSHRELPGTGAPAWLVDGVRLMDEESNLRGGVPRLQELAHVSPAHLTATCRRYFFRTPTDLVAMLRLRHAAFLLATTAEHVGEIARRCGFSSIAYFSATFRRENQMTPTEFRAQAHARSLAGRGH